MSPVEAQKINAGAVGGRPGHRTPALVLRVGFKEPYVPVRVRTPRSRVPLSDVQVTEPPGRRAS